MPYEMSASYNGIDLFKTTPDLRRCAKCGLLTHKWEEFADSPNKPKADISTSVNGHTMVSPKFWKIYEENEFFGVDFWPLSSRYHVLFPTRTVEIDPIHYKIMPLKLCERCGQYEEILVHGKPRLAASERSIASNEIVRSATDYGGKMYKGYHVFIGDNVRDILEIKSLSGLSLTKMDAQQ